MNLRARFVEAAELVARSRDLLDARAWDGATVPALADRGWETFLSRLDDDDLDRLEIEGASALPPHAPASLREFVDAIRSACVVEPLALEGDFGAREPRRRETPRKHRQVDAFAAAVAPVARAARRIVDVGSGHGHLTRELAARFDREVLGLDRNPGFAARARALSLDDGGDGRPSGEASFIVTDVLADGLSLARGDLAVGLHACGELGDAMVERAAEVGASVALVGCCLQKRSEAVRVPLARCAAAMGPAIELPRKLLGLTNLTPRDCGVEASRAENLASRERRLCLHTLLSRRIPALAFGAELEGLNRRAGHLPLSVLVGRAFAARGLELPGATEVEDARRSARAQHALARRLSVPRNLMARVVESFVVLDRAVFLEERGHAVRVGTVFPVEASARNLMVVARAR